MIHQLFTEQQITGAQHLIDAAHRVVILTHMSPDGDAMGSSLAMRHYLLSLPHIQSVTNIVPNAIPGFLTWMPDADQVLIYENDHQRATNAIMEADLIVCTDFGEPKRIGDIEPLLRMRECPKLCIDHHLHPDDFADVLISYPEASSASELVYRLIISLCSNSISGSIATSAYTGIMTDTGNFQFSCADPELYEIVADLLRAGIDKISIYDQVFNSFSEDRLRLTGYCLNKKMRILELPNTDVRVSLIALDRKELYRFNFQSGDAEGIVNLPMQITEVKYSCFMREDKDKIKLSFRSQGNRPVNIFAHNVFNGGGHANAAGGEFHGSLADAVATFLKNYRLYLH